MSNKPTRETTGEFTWNDAGEDVAAIFGSVAGRTCQRIVVQDVGVFGFGREQPSCFGMKPQGTYNGSTNCV